MNIRTIIEKQKIFN